VGREAFGQVPAGERAEEIIDVFNELATLSHELIESREKLLKEKAPQSLPDFYARVATVVEQFEPLVRLGQGTATVAEAEYRGGKPDEALLHDIIAAENPGVLGEPGARPDKIEVLLAGHRLPKGGPPVGGPEGPPVRLEEPPMRPPEGPPEPGRFHE
jgi:hypothetical protein